MSAKWGCSAGLVKGLARGLARSTKILDVLPTE